MRYGELSRALTEWAAEGLLTGEQAEAIRARYLDDAPAERRGRVVRTLAVVGAVVAGLGVILFFAANWDELARPVRVALVLGALLAAYGAGYRLRHATRSHPAVGEALLLLGAIMFGASLFLVGQMYHVQAHDPFAFLLWSAAALATGAAVRSRWVAVLGLVALGAWLGHEAWDLAGDEGLGYLPAILALYGTALYGLGTAFARPLTDLGFGGPMRVLGLGLWAGGVFVFTFHGYVELLGDRDPLAGRATLGLAMLGLAAAAGAAALLRRHAWEALAAGATVLLVLLAVLIPDASGVALTLLFNVLVAALGLGAIALGFTRDEPWLVNAGIGLVAVDVFARYVDVFWDLLPRSLVFVGAGALLLALSFAMERQRGRLLARMESA